MTRPAKPEPGTADAEIVALRAQADELRARREAVERELATMPVHRLTGAEGFALEKAKGLIDAKLYELQTAAAERVAGTAQPKAAAPAATKPPPPPTGFTKAQVSELARLLAPTVADLSGRIAALEARLADGRGEEALR